MPNLATLCLSRILLLLLLYYIHTWLIILVSLSPSFVLTPFVPLFSMAPSSCISPAPPPPPAPSFQRNLVIPSTKMTLTHTNTSCANDMLLAMPKPQFKGTHSTPLIPTRPCSQPERSHSHTTRSVSAAEPTRKQEQLSASSFSKIRLLGKGDVGKVYLVKQKDTGSLYALKGEHHQSSFLVGIIIITHQCCCI